MPDAPVAIAVVEDDPRYRSYLRTLVDGTPGFRCAGAFASAEAALAAATGNPPDVVLMDLELPGMPGERAISAFRELLPHVDVLVLTFHSEAEHLFPSLEAGACGYLVKPIDPAQLVAAVQEARNGGAPMSGPIARLVLHSFRRRADERRDLEGLTARELEVLRLIATGTLPQETAAQLGISERTVQTHLRNIYDKLHVHSRSQAVARFLARDRDRARTPPGSSAATAP